MKESIEELARQERNAYYREYRIKNKKKIEENSKRCWERKAEKKLEEKPEDGEIEELDPAWTFDNMVKTRMIDKIVSLKLCPILAIGANGRYTPCTEDCALYDEIKKCCSLKRGSAK
ncbi:MAG TPA: hypothetical protein VFC41_08960 [Anaerovoracaceae bacterium]|nr:hypothetical protein [Anaerovoracaceae bacterium]